MVTISGLLFTEAVFVLRHPSRGSERKVNRSLKCGKLGRPEISRLWSSIQTIVFTLVRNVNNEPDVSDDLCYHLSKLLDCV